MEVSNQCQRCDGYDKLKNELMSPLFVNNAGLIILSPFLGVLFDRCGLTTDEAFKNSRAETKAVQLLDYAATGQSISGEHELVLQKILCGIPLQNPITISEEISEDHKTIVIKKMRNRSISAS